MIDIFLKKNKGIKLNADSLKNDDLKKLVTHENIVIENLTPKIDEKHYQQYLQRICNHIQS